LPQPPLDLVLSQTTSSTAVPPRRSSSVIAASPRCESDAPDRLRPGFRAFDRAASLPAVARRPTEAVRWEASLGLPRLHTTTSRLEGVLRLSFARRGPGPAQPARRTPVVERTQSLSAKSLRPGCSQTEQNTSPTWRQGMRHIGRGWSRQHGEPPGKVLRHPRAAPRPSQLDRMEPRPS